MILASKFSRQDVKCLKTNTVFKGYFQVEELQLQFRCFDGGWSQTITREVFERGEAAAVLPYDPVTDQVVLIEQFRVGAFNDANSPWLLEVIAGIIESDHEDPEQTLLREAKEEADLTLKHLAPICTYWVSPGGTTEQCHLYYAQVDATQAGGIHGAVDEGEDIRVVVCDAQEAIAAVASGRINNAATIIALQWLQVRRLSG